MSARDSATVTSHTEILATGQDMDDESLVLTLTAILDFSPSTSTAVLVPLYFPHGTLAHFLGCFKCLCRFRMWLDRFSAHTSPAGSPRRSFQTQRPGLPARTTSLSVLSNNTSSTSLPSSARVPGGSSLKNQISASAPEDVEDPLAVLERVLGVSIEKEQDKDGTANAPQDEELVEKPSQLSEDLEFGQSSLQEFLDHSGDPNSAVVQPHPHSTHSIEECMNFTLNVCSLPCSCPQ